MKKEDFEHLFERGQFVYVNRTMEYLAPVLNHYGEEFKSFMKKVAHTGIFMGDIFCKIEGDYYLFSLINVERSKRKHPDFNNTLEALRQSEAYAFDYPFGELFGGKLHVIMWHVPEEYRGAYDRIMRYLNERTNNPDTNMRVEYSKMFSEDQINKLFVKLYGKNTKQVKVFKKDPEYRREFEATLNNIGISSVDSQGEVSWLELPKEAELEFLPNPKDEILNL